MKSFIYSLSIILLVACSSSNSEESNSLETNNIGKLEVVAELDINPGNVAVSNDGRVFTSVHPMRAPSLQLIEVLSDNQYEAFPDTSMQSDPEMKTNEKFDTPLGIIFDKKNRLWIIDAGLNLGVTRLFAFDIQTKEQLYRFDIPSDLAPASSFTQDLAVDETNGFVYLADFGDPGIIVVNINDSTFRKISHPNMAAEDIDMVIGGKKVLLNGEPARIGINPLTLSEDREALYYGSMSGTKWYSISAASIRNEASEEEVLATIKTVGPKSISDGVATDDKGNHYITNIQNSSIDVLSADGELSTLVKDELLDWPDNVRIHKDWLYIAVNQLHKAPPFTGGGDEAIPPFRIVRVQFR